MSYRRRASPLHATRAGVAAIWCLVLGGVAVSGDSFVVLLALLGAVLAAGALLVEIVVVIGLKAGDALTDEASINDAFGSPEEIGRLFLTDHLLAFEITSIVLLIAAVGGVVLGTRSRAEDEEELARARA